MEKKNPPVDFSVLFQDCRHSYAKRRNGKVPSGLAASLNAPEECCGPLSHQEPAPENFEVAPIESPFYTILCINALQRQRGVAREREKNTSLNSLTSGKCKCGTSSTDIYMRIILIARLGLQSGPPGPKRVLHGRPVKQTNIHYHLYVVA